MPKPNPKRLRVLFICMGNACRSQLAEAIAKHTADDVIDSSSAGLAPLGYIPPLTAQVLRDRGIPLEGHTSKGFDRLSVSESADLVINMSGVPGESLFKSNNVKFEDWRVEDPFGEDVETYSRICDDVQGRVEDLAARLRAGRP